MRDLQDRVAIVTGAAKGMGREICLTLAQAGAHVALAAREREPLEQLAHEIAGQKKQALVQPTDVTDEAAVEALVNRVRAAWGGRIDILVNAAGTTGPIETPVWEISEKDWDSVLAVNLKGTFLPTKHVLPTMIAQRYGKIINISGSSGLRGYKFRAAYSSSKWALRGFTRTVALEVGAYNINVNALHPGYRAGRAHGQAVPGESPQARVDSRAGLSGIRRRDGTRTGYHSPGYRRCRLLLGLRRFAEHDRPVA